MGRKIYVASSWRNESQPFVVAALRGTGHEVYDFKNPESNFAWSEIDPGWANWTREEYLKALRHPLAQAGFDSDMKAMEWADTFVLVLPCGRSAHLELGWAVGSGKFTAIILDNISAPELMVKMVDMITPTIGRLVELFRPGAEIG